VRRWIILSLWLAGIAALGLWAESRVRVESNLSGFLPTAASLDERVLLAQLRNGVAARTVLAAIARPGAPPESLATASRALTAALADSPRFLQVANGESPPLDEAALTRLFDYRYLIGPTGPCVDALSEEGLRNALQVRLKELSSALPPLDRGRMASDPTACLRSLLFSLVPRQGPTRSHGVWFSPDLGRALLVFQTAGDATDLDVQRTAIAEIRDTFATLPQTQGLHLELAGPGYFAVGSAQTIRDETVALSLAATGAVALILFVTFRSVTLVVIGALPGIAGLLVGLALVQAGYGCVHGIALAMGTTLFGVALDYPAHVFSHVAPGESPDPADPGIWPTLLLAAAATVMGYGALALTEFSGLAQLGILAAVGLATAALCARYLLPPLIPARYRVPAHRWLERTWSLPPRAAGWATGVGLVLAAVVLAAALIRHPHPWESDLARMSTVPRAELVRDTALRTELGAPDVRRFFYTTAPDLERLLQTLEAALPALMNLERNGGITGFDAASLWVPSAHAQQERARALPERSELDRRLELASQGLPFRPGAFSSFLDGVASSRRLTPLVPADLVGTLVGVRLSLLIQPLDDLWLGLIPLTGVPEADATPGLRALAAANGLHYLDLRAVSGEMLGRFLGETLTRTLILGLAIVLVLAAGLRNGRRLVRVLTPMAIALTLDFSLMVWAAGAVNLFHLVSLLLVLGLAIDYSLFFSRPMVSREEHKRTLLSLTVCTASTFVTFGLLALSSIPVLHAIGSTVAVGNLLAFFMAALLARAPPPAGAPCGAADPGETPAGTEPDLVRTDRTL
jgi:predicted exporter